MTAPDVDDLDILDRLGRTSMLNAAPAIRRLKASIEDRYADYVRCSANPWSFDEDPKFHGDRNDLEGVYQSEPVPLTYFSKLRQTEGACPMCGGYGTGTLDHYLPKSLYPELAFFSKNLVPACARCNSGRGNVCRGDESDERPLHPYFDAPLARRVVAVQVSGPYEVPAFDLVLYLAPAAIVDALHWHIEHIVLPAGLRARCMHLWSRLIAQPQLHLGDRSGERDVQRRLMECADKAADLGCSPNCWDASFYFGVAMNPEAVHYLAGHLAASL